METADAAATAPLNAWLVTLGCGHLSGLPDGPVPPLVHCASCGQGSRVVLAVRQ